METVTIKEFVDRMCRFGSKDMTYGNIKSFVEGHIIEPSSLTPYVGYNRGHYTRNLVYRNDLFEILTICWDVGQGSPIHNHQDQNCWMMVPIGKLLVKNYDVVSEDSAKQLCQLRFAEDVTIDRNHPGSVDPKQPIHAVINSKDHRERATSLHIYSLPYESCLVYCLEAGTYREVPLTFDTEYGKAVQRLAAK